MRIYGNIIDQIIERMQEERNKDRIYAYMDVAQMIRDELERESERDTGNNWRNAGNNESAAGE